MTTHISRLQVLFNQYLEQNPFKGNPKGLYEAKNYLVNLGGKRARPIALLAALEAAGGDVNKGLRAAWGFEVFHNFTLAHDDIMDDANLRRGKPTMHAKFNVPTAILAGDNMMMLVYKRLMGYEPNDSLLLMKLITQTGIEICEGQFMDMGFEEMDNVSQESYLKMIELKTAVLLAACLKAGGSLGGASENDLNALYNLGIQLGMGFQIKDDLLDAFSSNPKVGKVQGGDIIVNKKTILLIKALELANESQRKELKYWLSLAEFDITEKVDAVLNIFSDLRIEQSISGLMNDYYNKAFLALDKLSFSEDQSQSLKEFVQFIADREH